MAETNSNVQTMSKDKTTPLAERVQAYFEQLQQRICAALEEIEQETRFTDDAWERTGGGGGLTRVMENGRVFEKAGVNTSTVFGSLPATIATKMNVPASEFFATGVSLVIHPRSPMIPTVHANYRYFQRADGDAWFGGGSDLTPYYPFDEDIVHFHRTLKDACDRIDGEFYPRFKKSCDEYFYIPHRGEARGVGGIFFDYLRGESEKHFALVQSAGDVFPDAYLPIVERRMKETWGDPEREWQLIRRGRYVEFNLIYDRGTLFGLETQGRAESILMSLPPSVEWRYDVSPPGPLEARLVQLLKHPREWVNDEE